MQTILCFDRKRVNENQINEYKSHFYKLLYRKSSGGTNEEKIRNNLYSARINDAKRILFTRINKDRREYLLILQILENHDYNRSVYINYPNRIAEVALQFSTYLSHIDTNEHNNFAVSTALIEDECVNDDDNTNENATIFETLFFVKNQFAVCDNSQRNAITAPYSSMIGGAPGSGKTCIALNFIRSALEEHTLENKGHVFYITRTIELANSSRDTLFSQLRDEGINKIKIVGNRIICPLGTIHFQDFNAQERCFFPGEKQVITQEQCLGYIGDWQKNNKHSALSKKDAKNIYFALTILNSLPGDLKSKEQAFKDLGARQNCLRGPNEMAALCSLNTNILSFIEKQNGFHMGFNALNHNSGLQCDAIFVDEAQNFTVAEFFNFSTLTQGRVMLFIDANQDTVNRNDHGIRELFLHLYKLKYGTDFNHLTLEQSHRSSQKVVTVFNMMLKLNNILFGAADKLDYRQVLHHDNADTGRFELHTDIKTLDADLIKHINLRTGELNPVIVLDDEDKELIKSKFHTIFVLSSKQAHGLEYNEVCVYISAKTHRLLQNYFSQKNINIEQDIRYRSTEALNHDDEKIRHVLRELFIAMSRAKVNIHLIIDGNMQDLRQNSMLVQFLQEHADNCLTAVDTPNALSKNEISVDKYCQEIKKQIAHNNLEVALDIFKEYLEADHITHNNPDEAFEAFKQYLTNKSNVSFKKYLEQESNTVANYTQTSSLEQHQVHAGAAAASSPAINNNTTNCKPQELNTDDNQVDTALSSYQAMLEKYIPTEEERENEVYKSWERSCTQLKILFNNRKSSNTIRDSIGILFKNASAGKLKDQKLKYLNYFLFCQQTELKLSIFLSLLCDKNYGLDTMNCGTAFKNINPIGLNFLHNGNSLLYALCSIAEGKTVLKDNQQLLIPEFITKEAFNARLPASAGEQANTSPLFWLCCNDEGRNLLNNNPHLLSPEFITKESFNARAPANAGAHANTSPLYLLCASEVKNKLLTNNPHLLSRDFISKEAFNFVLTNKLNTSPLFWLCCRDKGQELLKRNQHLLSPEFITKESFNARLPANAGIWANTSPLYWLCYTDVGKELLKNIPHLLSKDFITKESITAIFRSDQGVSVAPLHFICWIKNILLKDNLYLLRDEYISLLPNDEIREEMICNIVNDHNFQEALSELKACRGYDIINSKLPSNHHSSPKL